MPYLKPISGHTSCRGVARYLEQKKRAVAKDFINCCDRQDHIYGFGWAKQMDDTRELCDNNKNTNQYRTRTYAHFVLSPDPRDEIDLITLRKLTTDWTVRFFEHYQCAIIYHYDTDVPHAHAVINNTNLATGKRLSPTLTNPFMRKIRVSLDEMARERGLRSFLDREEAREGGCDGVSLDVIEQNIAERKLDRKDPRWKDDIYDRVARSLDRATTYDKFVSLCRENGIEVGRTKDGECLYTLVEIPTRKVSAPRLDMRFSKAALTRKFGVSDGLLASPRETRQKVYRSKTEQALLAEGRYSWKEDIRDRVQIAKAVSRNTTEFETACREIGLDVRTGRDGQYVFALTGIPSRQVGTTRLGYEYRKDAIARNLIINRDKSLAREEVFRAVQDFRIGEARVVAHIHPSSKITLRQIAYALNTIAHNSISGLDEFDELHARAVAKRDAKCASYIAGARSIAAQCDLVPKSAPPKSVKRGVRSLEHEGRRTPKSTQHRTPTPQSRQAPSRAPDRGRSR